MLAPAVARRGLAALMNAVPASAAARFDTSARSARVLRPLVNALLPEAPTTVVVRASAARGTRLRIDPRHEEWRLPGPGS